MSRSAAVSTEKPRKNVWAESGLNKSNPDHGWFAFRRQAEYKLNWNRGILIVVPPYNTNRTGPPGGHIAKQNQLKQAQLVCVDCGHQETAEVVGAKCIGARTPRCNLWRRRLWPGSQDHDKTCLDQAGTHRSDYPCGQSCVAP